MNSALYLGRSEQILEGPSHSGETVTREVSGTTAAGAGGGRGVVNGNSPVSCTRGRPEEEVPETCLKRF